MNSFFLDSLNLKSFKFLIKHLTQIHDNTLVDFLPQVRSEKLNQRNLQCGDLTMHENTGKIKLHLETNVHIGTVDGGTPPQSKATVGNLGKTRTLSIRKLLVFHLIFETRCLLPEQSFPCREVTALEQCVLKTAFHTTESSNNICAVLIQLPQLAIMSL